MRAALGLLDFLAAHAARAVDDEDDGLGDRTLALGFDFGAGQQQKVAVFAGLGPVADDARADAAIASVEHQAKVVAGDDLGSVVGDDGVLVVGSFDFYGVGSGVDVLDR